MDPDQNPDENQHRRQTAQPSQTPFQYACEDSHLCMDSRQPNQRLATMPVLVAHEYAGHWSILIAQRSKSLYRWQMHRYRVLF